MAVQPFARLGHDTQATAQVRHEFSNTEQAETANFAPCLSHRTRFEYNYTISHEKSESYRDSNPGMILFLDI